MTNPKVDKTSLFNELIAWDSIIGKKVHLIACGDTALTLVDVKETTTDIHFIVPKYTEYDYLTKILQQAGYVSNKKGGLKREYGFRVDFFRGGKTDAIELINSPLEKDWHIPIKQYKYMYVGVLNYYDIIICKLFRAKPEDLRDCLALVKARQDEIEIDKLKKLFLQTIAGSANRAKVSKHLDSFLRILKKEKLLVEN
ncbi:MAG: hypothetical protein A3J83_01090 [Elusimicrobia bacterium RIFOXYA2_FULL_40_6]|nr:MAG: hypothetical protein A3J83_01090 [Elusimicrobia bacterium RIFOXYA2_FULL_40_6]